MPSSVLREAALPSPYLQTVRAGFPSAMATSFWEPGFGVMSLNPVMVALTSRSEVM